MNLNVGILYSRIRRDEKLLLSELRDRGHEVTKVDVRKQQFNIGDPPEEMADVDILVDRCLATSRSLYATQFAEAYDIPVVNDHATAEVCANKVKNSLALQNAGVPTPETDVAFTKDAAIESIEAFGYPCVLKPVIGSWGRLMAKIDSRSAAEAILEHKETLGHYEHKVFYIQEFVDKPGRDIRVLAVDGEPVAGMVRSSDHWLTNAAKGATTEEVEITPEMRDLVEAASDAVGDGLLGVDLMETGVDSEARRAADARGDDEEPRTGDPSGFTVHEVNHTVEFKALDEVTEVDLPARVVDWLEERAGAASETAEVTT
jgi:[lysine-biosynthesis-protein LysW]--L-2-aminoadipate ligase